MNGFVTIYMAGEMFGPPEGVLGAVMIDTYIEIRVSGKFVVSGSPLCFGRTRGVVASLVLTG